MGSSVSDSNDGSSTPQVHEVVVIGAGITGIYQIWKLREAGIPAIAVEAGGGVGGTWYWNRYPLARFDSESYSYGYFFNEEIWREWKWTEHYAAQPETERYLNFVVDKLAIRDTIKLNSRVTSAVFDQDSATWDLTINDTDHIQAKFVIAATGILSAPFFPDIPGREDFCGRSVHPGLWPVQGVDTAGKRVAVIGTGSTGVQVIPAIAEDAAHLTVYQRSAGWSAPLWNRPITEEEQADLENGLEKYQELTRKGVLGFIHPSPPKAGSEATYEERQARFEEFWNMPGHARALSMYTDLTTNPEVNREFSDFVAAKVRTIVTAPATAELLIPNDHGYGTRRPPLGTNYYETYNLPNVELVDLKATPIVKVTASGIETTDGHEEYDVIVWATGFDAFTGALTRMNISGPNGLLQDYWKAGPLTYLGIQIPGYPNLFLTGGPQSPAGNVPRATEMSVDFVTKILLRRRQLNAATIECDDTGADEWAAHIAQLAAGLILAPSNNANGTNIPGKATVFLRHIGPFDEFRKLLDDNIADDFARFHFSGHDDAAPVQQGS